MSVEVKEIKPKIPESWEVRKLGSLAEIKTGKSNSCDAIEKGIYPFFDRSMKIKWSNKYLFDARAIIIPGEGKEFLPRYFEGKFDLHQRAYAIFNFSYKVIPKYIYYYLLNNRDYFSKIAVGSTVKSLRLRHFTEMDILLPPLPEQEKITEILASFDDQIENLMEQNKTLEEIAKTIFKRWFIDFEFPNEEGKPYKSSGGEFIDSELGKIPKGWRVGIFGEFVDIVKGLSYKGKFLTEKSDIILINLKNVGLDGSFRYEGIKYYEGDYKENHVVKSGDIVIATTDLTRNGNILANPILIPNLENKITIISMDLSKVMIKEEKYKWFLFFLMKTKSFKNFAKSYSSGTTVLHLKLDGLKKYKFPLPQMNTLESFYYLSENIMNKIVLNNNQIQTLTQLRDILLPKLITGQIRVKV